jgi:S-adenosylmethionine decarboxylase
MDGLHLTADLHGCLCEAAWLTDAARLVAWCREAVLAAGLQPVADLAHTFPAGPSGPGGVTATILLAESHLCLHTWPELGAVTADVYVCNFGADHSAKARHLMAAVLRHFRPEAVDERGVQRGRPYHLAHLSKE